ncbi:hypothetical protein QVD17_30572 [Tagetes erecta]|uniref:MULE transposase domain-containing protein n=1 Tax=Tagetes erecta TaxID=13708 RepID=A0AAD8NNI4_TARER|nr:hypothetical protein QVD17_30572 [Tagetes erecta]
MEIKLPRITKLCSGTKTVKPWHRCTVVSSSHSPLNCSVFRYMFWAFRPSIEAFSFCIPVISIDATHLKGPYKGKILMAVSKNPNNMILPVAYAIVDEETNESWKWFLQQFEEHVEDPKRRKLCVISDRHAGIKHAMDNLPSWKEPHAYHRFCLRHVRSNFM